MYFFTLEKYSIICINYVFMLIIRNSNLENKVIRS